MAKTPGKTMLAVLAIVVGICALAASAHAATLGQIGKAWGGPGFNLGQFHQPALFGVDPVDGSVYVGDITANEQSYRIQKLDSAGKVLGSVLIPRKKEAGGKSYVARVHGIAVDHARERFYIVESCKFKPETGLCQPTGSNLHRATSILAFKTAPVGEALVQASAIPVPTASAEAVFEPQAVAVDPSSGEPVLFGYDSEIGLGPHAVVERVSATGSVNARYVDTAGALDRPTDSGLDPQSATRAYSIAVGPDGSVYALTSGFITEASGEGGVNTRAVTRGWHLPRNLSQVEPIPAINAAAQSEGWTTNVIESSTGFTGGPEIAISPDGKSLYWKEGFSSEAAGSFTIVRGFSLASGATSAIYGGGKGGRCEIESGEAALAATGEKLIVFDYNNFDGGTGEGEGLNSVITFGPGGDGCGGQDVRLTADGSAVGPVQVEQGASVQLDASESVLVGQVEKLEWDFGDGTPKEVVAGPGPSLKTSHVFEQATKVGEPFSVVLKVSVKGEPVAEASVEVEVAAGVPAPPRAFIEVLEPGGFFVAAGGTVRFDASQSWDPIAGTSLLKKYVWSFGDGSPEVATTAPSVVHTFANPGGSALQRLVVLTVESASGGTGSDRRLITVLGPPGSGPVPGGTGSVAPPSSSPPPSSGGKPNPKPGKRPLTAKQRRQKAIAKCKKLPAGSRKRQGCLERAARIGKGTGGKKKGSGS